MRAIQNVSFLHVVQRQVGSVTLHDCLLTSVCRCPALSTTIRSVAAALFTSLCLLLRHHLTTPSRSWLLVTWETLCTRKRSRQGKLTSKVVVCVVRLPKTMSQFGLSARVSAASQHHDAKAGTHDGTVCHLCSAPGSHFLPSGVVPCPPSLFVAMQSCQHAAEAARGS